MRNLLLLILLPVLTTLASPALAEGALVDSVLAVVNDRTILASELRVMLAPLVAKLSRSYEGVELKERVEDGYQKALQSLIERELVLSNYELPNPQALDAVVEERLTDLVAAQFDGDRNAFLLALQSERMSEDEWRATMRDRMAVSIIHRREVEGRVSVSPGMVAARYRETADSYSRPAEVWLRTIVLRKNGAGPEIELRRQQAEDLVERAKAGEAFPELAKEFSDDVKAAKGGDNGWVTQSDLRTELADAAFALDAGELSDVIDTRGAFYILKLEGKRDADTASLAEVRKDIEQQLKEEEYERLRKAWMKKLSAKSFIKVMR